MASAKSQKPFWAKPRFWGAVVLLIFGVPQILNDTSWWNGQAIKLAENVGGAIWPHPYGVAHLRGALVAMANYAGLAMVALAAFLLNLDRVTALASHAGSTAVNAMKRGFRRTQIAMQEVLNKEVLLSLPEAIRLIRHSEWARIRELHGEEPKTIFSVAIPSSLYTSNPQESARKRLFNGWLKRVLETFEKNEPQGIEFVDGKKAYKKSVLEKYIQERYEMDLIAAHGEFG